jgi:hypothetical protein
LPLLLLGAFGCAWQEQNVPMTSWLQRPRGNAIEGAHAILEVALIERPLGDAYVNRDLWDSVDELVVDLDRRSALDDNGLRVGQLVGSPPQAFQTLLLSKRSCSNPHALMIPPGRTMPLYLGPVLPHSSYELVEGTQKIPIQLDQARYCLDVTPTLTAEGTTKLSFTPKVEHGEVLLPFQPSPDESGWTLRIERANKKYPDLSWDVTLASNQYLIIGARLDRGESLGHRAFIQDDDGSVQRLLVIRCGKAVAPPQPGDGSIDDFLNRQCPPLALQATVAPVARAQKH